MTPPAELPTEEPGGTQFRFSAQDLVELGVAYALILAAIWTLNP